MNHKNETLPVKLQKPGAGIPFLHQLFLKYFVAKFIAARTSWSVSEIRYNKINQRILKEIRSLNDKQLSTRVLIPPQLGLEDSSRFWSIAMTVEHLLIVGDIMHTIIASLSREELPDIKVNIADLKPTGLMPSTEVFTEFELFVTEDTKKVLSQLKNRDSQLQFKHPWFGEINARQWFWVMVAHHSLHLNQIREIRKQLSVV